MGLSIQMKRQSGAGKRCVADDAAKNAIYKDLTYTASSI
jgi:hypothetical protein